MFMHQNQVMLSRLVILGTLPQVSTSTCNLTANKVSFCYNIIDLENEEKFNEIK